MSITLRPVTRDNWELLIHLRPAPEQEGLVAPNLYSIAEASFNPDMVPLVIYAEEEPVGFLMWGQDPDDGAYWLLRLMVDHQHQGKGYAKAAMELWITEMRQRTDCDRLTLGYKPHNPAAQFYAKLGFMETGEELHGEKIARLIF